MYPKFSLDLVTVSGWVLSTLLNIDFEGTVERGRVVTPFSVGG